MLTPKTLALIALLTPFCTSTPHIRVDNQSKQKICYRVEYSSGLGAFPNETTCDVTGPEIGGFWLNSNQSTEVKATGFNGAITAVLNNEIIGARNEINFLDATQPFYDISYQYGISNGTCGPQNSSNLAGERDALGKANKAWRTLNTTAKADLLKYDAYLRQDANGSLNFINMTIDAWPSKALKVIQFFQMTAQFNAYMSPGNQTTDSWAPGSTQAELVALASKQTLSEETERIVIISY